MAKNQQKKTYAYPMPQRAASTKATPSGAPVATPGARLYSQIKEGREFESLLALKTVGQINISLEIREALQEIQQIRGRPVICYLANVVNPKIKAPRSIDLQDDLPFAEMVSNVDAKEKSIDIILITPGGSATQVSKFVDRLRPRFDHVTFIVLNMAMSAGTIFAMSGDEIIMDSRSYIGPIDPQVPNREGQFVPAQALLTLIADIQSKGETAIKAGQSPQWSDLQLLRQIDPKDLGNALSASNFSVELVENYLYTYKFKTWVNHSNGNPVTDEEKKARAHEIAAKLCNHNDWKSHARGIPRDVAWDICKLKIIHAEDITGLDVSVKKLWALLYWIFENTPVTKLFISNNYSIVRQDSTLLKQPQNG